MDFGSIEYLKAGNQLQRAVHKLLSENRVMEKLQKFQPILVGTIPINITIKDSDLDIVCTFDDKELFKVEIQYQFSAYPEFLIIEKSFQNEPTVIVKFKMERFPVEIFAQRKPSKQQIACQHLLIEHKILEENDEEFRSAVIQLKKKGDKK